MVKKLFVMMAVLAMSISAKAQVPDALVDLAGTWTHYLGPANGQYVCTWTAGFNYSCAVSFAYNGGTCHVTYPGTWVAAGSWSYTSVYVSGTCPTNGVWSGYILEGGYSMCDLQPPLTCTNNYSWFRTAGANSVTETNEGQTTKIEVPGTIGSGSSSGGEAATIDKGESQYIYQGFLFEGEDSTAVLKDPADVHANFAGHLTTEIVTPVSNTCLPLTVGSGSQWTPDDINDYSVGNVNLGTGNGDQSAPDIIAVTFDYINRNQRSWTITLPCTVTDDQRMTLNLPSDSGTVNWIYQDHLLKYQIGDGWVKATRNGVGTQRNHGTKRSVWRTNDWMTMCMKHIAPCM